MNEEYEIDLVLSEATCHTEDCANRGIAMRVQVDRSNPLAVCGVCFQQINDIKIISD